MGHQLQLGNGYDARWSLVRPDCETITNDCRPLLPLVDARSGMAPVWFCSDLFKWTDERILQTTYPDPSES